MTPVSTVAVPPAPPAVMTVTPPVSAPVAAPGAASAVPAVTVPVAPPPAVAPPAAATAPVPAGAHTPAAVAAPPSAVVTGATPVTTGAPPAVARAPSSPAVAVGAPPPPMAIGALLSVGAFPVPRSLPAVPALRPLFPPSHPIPLPVLPSLPLLSCSVSTQTLGVNARFGHLLLFALNGFDSIHPAQDPQHHIIATGIRGLLTRTSLLLLALRS